MLFLLLACDRLPDLEAPTACSPRVTRYADSDGDGVGDLANVYIGCEAPENYVDVGGDCDDNDPGISSGCDSGGSDSGGSDSGGSDSGGSDSGGSDSGSHDSGTAP